MTSKAETIAEYLEALPPERKLAVSKLHKLIKTKLPKGFEDGISYGMIGYFVPHSLYPEGYHCNPELPLPFMSIASQKNYIAVYHMGIYADKKLLDWFTNEYKKDIKSKLDMGKSCIRFKKPEEIPYDLIGKLTEKITPQDWIKTYEKIIKNKN